MNMDEFLPSEKEIKVLEGVETSEKSEFISNRYRNILAITLLILSGISTFLFLETKHRPWQFLESLAQLDVQTFIQKHTQKIGGDIEVPPPVPVIVLPKLIGTLPAPDSFSAHSILVKDVETGAILYQKNEYEQRSLASISKLLSALVLLENPIDWTTTTIIASSTDIFDSHIFDGEKYTLSDLWDAGLVASSNKAIVALVQGAGISEDMFVQRMNQKAIELGMRDSHFVEPTGLSSENISTASDVALLLEEALKHEKIRDTLLLTKVKISPLPKKKSREITNTNWLLLDWIPNKIKDFRGGKTGYIIASGYNFAMQVGEGENKVIDVVVLGADTHEARFTEARDISEDIYRAFEWPEDAVSSSVSSTMTTSSQKTKNTE